MEKLRTDNLFWTNIKHREFIGDGAAAEHISDGPHRFG